MRKVLREDNAPLIHGWVLDIKTGLIKDLTVLTSKWELNPSCPVPSSLLPWLNGH